MNGADLGPAMEASYNRQIADAARNKADGLQERVEVLEAVCIKLIEEVTSLRGMVGDNR